MELNTLIELNDWGKVYKYVNNINVNPKYFEIVSKYELAELSFCIWSLLDVGFWNQLIYYNKKSFPVISIMFDEIDIGIYQDEDNINVSYGGKINHYRVKREIKNELAEFIKVH